MQRRVPVVQQAAACLNRLEQGHPAFADCDITSVPAVAARIRQHSRTFELPKGNGINLQHGRPGETPDAYITRCLGNTWRVCGHEYTLPSLDYNVSPHPRENSYGCRFGEWTWQFNRHSAWVVAALHYRRTGDTRALEALCGWIQTWLETCPAPTEAFDTELTSWRTIEIGIRLGQTWPWVFAAIHAEGLDDTLLLAWLNSVAEQCDFVWTHRKRNNWLMMEVNGLLTAALMFPFFAAAPTWEANALRVHGEEIDNQFLADGMQVELSASYHGVSFVQYLRAYDLLKRTGKAIPAAFPAGMRTMLKPWRAMVRPDGKVFGFQDSGLVDYAAWLKRIPDEFHAAEDAFFTQGGPEPGRRNTLLPNAGQAVLRSGWTLRDTAVAFDGGPYGEAHQHEDKLSIQIWARGRELLGEAGVMAYADSPQRWYSMGTLAHSTAIVDGCSQNSRRLFRKGERPLDARAGVACDLESAAPWVRAAYDAGYGAKGEIRVVHERTVTLHSAERITVTDRFHADDDAGHTVEILFHLLKDGFALSENGCRSTGAGPNLVLSAERGDGQPLEATVVRGGTEPDLRGWAARDSADCTGSYDLVARPCLTVKAEMVGAMDIVTTIRITD